MMKPGMTYNQLRELEKCAPALPIPVEYNPPEEPEHVPDMSQKVQDKVDSLRSKLMAVRAKSRE